MLIKLEKIKWMSKRIIHCFLLYVYVLTTWKLSLSFLFVFFAHTQCFLIVVEHIEWGCIFRLFFLSSVCCCCCCCTTSSSLCYKLSWEKMDFACMLYKLFFFSLAYNLFLSRPIHAIMLFEKSGVETVVVFLEESFFFVSNS